MIAENASVYTGVAAESRETVRRCLWVVKRAVTTTDGNCCSLKADKSSGQAGSKGQKILKGDDGQVHTLCAAECDLPFLPAVHRVGSDLSHRSNGPHLVEKANPFLYFLAVLEFMFGLVMALSFGWIPLAVAGGLWVGLLLAGDRVSTKAWTFAFLLAAVFGFYIFETRFQMQ